MRSLRWQLPALVCGLALAVAWTSTTEDRKGVLERRKALLKRLETLQRKWNVPPSDGKYLMILAESMKAKRALEIGSSYGYSALWIGMALEKTGGRLWTIEIDPARAQECRDYIKEAGLDNVVTSIKADAFDAIPKLEGEFDFVFIDAFKPDFKKYFDMVFPRVNEGGVIIAHNAISMRSDMQDYLDTVMNHPDLDSVFVITANDPKTPTRDGFCVSVRK